MTTGQGMAEPETDRHDPAFAHASEAEFARILDFYDVRWEYEPHVYPILWDLDGNVLESFAPDFYLPELDLYVEMTTLRQQLVRKKNRKLRRLRELYPDIRIKLFYARDFRALMLKYGRVALADALSGAMGQFAPADRPEAIEPASTAGSEPAGEPAAPTAADSATPAPDDTRPETRLVASRRARNRRRARRVASVEPVTDATRSAT